MKLLYANNYLYRRGGSERVMFDEAEGLASRGHQTFFFGHRHPEAAHLPFADHFPEAVDLSAVRGLARLGAASRVVHNGDAARRFGRVLDAGRPDLIHCHNIYAGLTPAILATARERGVPALVTLHDYKLACPSYLMLDHGRVCDACVGRSFVHCLARRCHKGSLLASAVTTAEATFNQWTGRWRRARFLLSPSRFLIGVMVRHGLPPALLRHVPNGVDLDAWRAGSDGEAFALYVGRLSHEKGIESLIRAAAGMALPLRVVGDGPERARLQRLAAELGASVHFEGHRTPGELQVMLRSATYLVVPSIWNENAPMTVIEAMAVGKPVIASRIGGIPELVEDEVTGLLVPPGDVGRLREAMRALAGDARRRAEMGRQARLRAEEEFSLRVHLDRIGSLYEEARSARAP